MVGGIRFRRRFFIWGLWLVSFFFFSFVFVLGGDSGKGRGGENGWVGGWGGRTGFDDDDRR